jgi:hypothetical protein
MTGRAQKTDSQGMIPWQRRYGMKKVVDGKLYDSETAEKIHSWSNGLDSGDFSWCRETL